MTGKGMIFMAAALIAGTAGVRAQQADAADGGKVWTLAECIDYAVEHNVGVRQSENQRAQRDIQLNTDRWSRLRFGRRIGRAELLVRPRAYRGQHVHQH